MTFDNADGNSQVKISAKGDKLAVRASAPTLATFIGSGTWSADLFGSGAVTTVGYTIAGAGTAPTIAIGSVAAPADVVVVQGTPKTKTSSEGGSASVQIVFTREGFTKKLDIKISVKAVGARAASLKITLSGKDKQKLSGALADLIGTHSWAGHLCNGTPVAFTYDVVDPGTLVFGAATGATATNTSDEDGLVVAFDGTKTRVRVSLHKNEDGTWTLRVSTRTDKCKDTPAADPTVNTPVSPDATKSGHGDGDDNDNHGNNSDKAKADVKAAKAANEKVSAKTARAGQSGHQGDEHHGG